MTLDIEPLRPWQVYIIRCTDGSLYTGITTDIERRMAEHASGKGARYFRGRVPDEVVYLETGHDRSSASRREAAIKQLRTREKHRLVATGPPGMASETPSQTRPAQRPASPLILR